MAKKEQIQLKSQPEKGKGKAEASVTLTLQGELTIDNAIAVKKFLLDNLAKYKHFSVKILSVDNIDLTMIQMLQRFMWDAKEQGKEAKFQMKLPDEFLSLIQRAGFQSLLTLSEQK